MRNDAKPLPRRYKLADADVIRLVAEGRTDPEIAAACGVHPCTVLERRQRLGLAAPYDPRNAPAAVRASWAKAAAVGSSVCARATLERSRRLAAAFGLPAMTPRSVRVVLALLDGPLTKAEVVQRAGKLKTRKCQLAGLVKAGLVARIQRATAARRRELPDVYTLTMATLEAITRGSAKRPDDGAPGDRAAGGEPVDPAAAPVGRGGPERPGERGE